MVGSLLPAGLRQPPKRYDLPFVSSHSETPTATTFRFSTSGTGFEYLSNLAVRIALPDSGDPRPWRLFSLSSSPSEEGLIAITAKMTGSPFKEALRALRPGQRVPVYGPVGDLIYDRSRPALLLAGGIGVTPFRGMLRYAADTGVVQPIVLLYSARTPEELAFRTEFDEITRDHPKFRVQYSVTRPAEAQAEWNGRTTRINELWVREALQGLERPKVYVAGLPEMARATVGMLKDRLGFSEDDLEYEYFMGY